MNEYINTTIIMDGKVGTVIRATNVQHGPGTLYTVQFEDESTIAASWYEVAAGKIEHDAQVVETTRTAAEKAIWSHVTDALESSEPVAMAYALTTLRNLTHGRIAYTV